MKDERWALPEKLKLQEDPLKLRLDFHKESVELTEFGEENSVRMVSAVDVAKALASELQFSSGLLPTNALWFANTKAGPLTAIWEAPRIRKVTLQLSLKEPLRYTIPLPGLIFLCTPGKPPAVYAAKKKPAKESDPVYHAPLCNVFQDGQTCPGSHKYPVSGIVESFFMSFFSATAHLGGRSHKFPKDVTGLWKWLDGKKAYPLEDLVKFGTVGDLMR